MLDDEAGSFQCATSVPAATGTVRGDSNLSVLDGNVVEGAWRLQIEDEVSGGTGILREWCIHLTFE